MALQVWLPWIINILDIGIYLTASDATIVDELYKLEVEYGTSFMNALYKGFA